MHDPTKPSELRCVPSEDGRIFSIEQSYKNNHGIYITIEGRAVWLTTEQTLAVRGLIDAMYEEYGLPDLDFDAPPEKFPPPEEYEIGHIFERTVDVPVGAIVAVEMDGWEERGVTQWGTALISAGYGFFGYKLTGIRDAPRDFSDAYWRCKLIGWADEEE